MSTEQISLYAGLRVVFRVEHMYRCPVVERWSHETMRDVNGSDAHPYHGPSFRDLKEIRSAGPSYDTCRNIPFGSRGPTVLADRTADPNVPGRRVIMTPEWWTGFLIDQAGSWWDPDFADYATADDWEKLHADGWRVGQYLVPAEYVQVLEQQVIFQPAAAELVDEFPMTAVAARETTDVLLHEEISRINAWLRSDAA